MKIAVIGSGAIGCLFGAYLSEQNEVIFITHTEATAEIINRDGVEVTGCDGAAKVYKNVKAFASGTYDEAVDLVIFIVKTTQSRDALETNRALVQNARLVMTIQNGGGNEDVLAEFAAPEKILLAVTRNNCVNLGNGRIKRNNDQATFVGTLTASADDVALVQQTIDAAGLEAHVVEDIQHSIWEKLFANIAGNSFSAITGLPLGAMVSSEHAWHYAELLIRESVEVACASGVHFDVDETLADIRHGCSMAPNGFPSMYQDVSKKKKTEVEAINGFVVRAAEKLGMSAPNNAFVVNLIHAIEENY